MGAAPGHRLEKTAQTGKTAGGGEVAAGAAGRSGRLERLLEG